MIRRLVDQAFNSGKYFISAVGLSTDVKPTEGIITGSKFVEVDTGIGYLFDETSGQWHENQQLSAAVQAYFEDHPEAIDQAAIEAMFGDQLDGIEEDLGGLKSALIAERTGYYQLTSGDLIQGSYNSYGEVVPKDNIIRTNGWIKVKSGYTIHFEPGANHAKRLLYGKFDANKEFIGDSLWFSTQSDITVNWDGYIIIVFSRGNNNAIAPSQYDALTKIIDPLALGNVVNTLRDDTYSRKNIIGMDSTLFYPVSIAPGTTLTMSTADGEPLGQNDLNLCFYDSDKNDISSGGWNFNPSYVRRTITLPATIGKTAKFVKWTKNPIKNVQLEIGSVASEYTPYSIDICNTELIRKIYVGVASKSQIIDNTFISDYSDKSVSDYADAYNAEVLNSSGNTEQFLFYTDPHLAYQTGNAPGMLPRTKTDINFIEKVYNALPFSFLLCGGDWLGNSDLKTIATEKLAYIDGFMRKKIKNYVPIIGNHDTNYQGYANESSQTRDGRINDSILKDYWQKFREEQKAYYLYKAPTCHIYIFDTGIEYEVVGDYQNEQLTWFANALMGDNSDHIVVSMHIFYPGTIASGVIQPLTDKVLLIAQAYNARTSIEVDGVTYNFDIEGRTNKVSFCIAGHTHRDTSGILHDIPFILSMDGTAQGAQEEGWSNDRLCTFDMCLADWDNKTLKLKRVGYGSDRQITIL